jgi:ribosomal protein L13E
VIDVPRINPIVFRPDMIREGKGFSISEIQELSMTPGEARRYGIPVDPRRATKHEENIEVLKDYLATVKEAKITIPRPKKVVKSQKNRAYRSKTSAGQKSRGLVKGKKKPK